MSKTSTKGADKAGKASKALNKVKDAGVTKASQSPAAKSKAVASKVISKEKSKKTNKKKEPTPSSSESESESESDEDMKDASSSSSSESESEEEKPVPKKTEKKVEKKVAAKAESSDSSDSDSSESEEEKPAPKKVEKKVAAKAESSDSSDSDSDSSESEDEKPAPKKTEKKAESSDSSDSESESEAEAKKASSDSESGSDSDSSDSDSEETPVSKKRKADAEPAATAKKSKTEDVPEGAVANLFIGNLSWNVDEEWLQREFSEFGELSGVRIVTDRETGRSRGFGYVEYTNAADAAKAMEAKKGTDLDGRTINLDYAAPRQANPQQGADRSQDRARSYGDTTSPESDTLFVGNLPFSATEDALHEVFGAQGSVLGIRLPTEQETGRPKGFGYVQFASIDEAKAAHAALNGHELEGRAIRLDFSTPRPAGGDRGGFGGRGGGGRGGGRGGFGGRGGGGGFGGRGGGGRGGGRGGFGDRGGRGGLNKGKGSIPEFKGTKVTF